VRRKSQRGKFFDKVPEGLLNTAKNAGYVRHLALISKVFLGRPAGKQRSKK
jgi:hypothetical protein